LSYSRSVITTDIINNSYRTLGEESEYVIYNVL
jgi:hypothetical protein